MVAKHKEAYHYLQSPSDLYDFTQDWTFGIPSVVGMFWREDRSLKDTFVKLEAGMGIYKLLTYGHGSGASQIMKADMAMLSGNIRSAISLFSRGLHRGKEMKQESLMCCARLGIAILLMQNGDTEGYWKIHKEIESMATENKKEQRNFAAEMCMTALYVQMEEYEKIPVWMYDEEQIERLSWGFAVPFVHIFSGILKLNLFLKHKISYYELEAALRGYAENSTKNQMMLPKIYFQLYLIIAKNDIGKSEDARQLLEEVFAITLKEDIYLPFAEHLAAVRATLSKVCVTKEQQKALEQIEKMGRSLAAGRKKIQKQHKGEEKALTPREREIAVLLKERKTVKEIARELFISPVTVRIPCRKSMGN